MPPFRLAGQDRLNIGKPAGFRRVIWAWKNNRSIRLFPQDGTCAIFRIFRQAAG
jgi:hypothetical protein